MAGHTPRRKKKFIAKAIEKPGALRATAKRMGLIKGDETLSASDLNIMESRARKSDNKKLLRRVLFARTLKKLPRRKKKKKS